MNEYLPILILGGFLGLVTLFALVAYIVYKKTQGKEFERNMTDMAIIHRLLHYVKGYWGHLVLALFIMLISVAHDVISPLMVGHIEETLAGEFELNYLFSLVGLYVGILLVSVACTYAQALLLQHVGQKILSGLRQDVYDQVQKLSHNQLSHIPVGKLVTRVVHDPAGISYLFTNIMVTLVKNIIMLVAVVVAMLMLNYALTLMLLSFVPFLVLLTWVFRKFSRRAHRAVTDATTDLNAFLSENLSGMKITQIFNREDTKMEEFKERSAALKNAKLNRMYVFGVFRPLVHMLNTCAVICLFYLSGRGYIQDTPFFGQVITGSVVVSFYLYISKFFHPIQSLAEQFDMLQKSFASAEKVLSVLDMVPEVVDESDAIELPEIRGEIEFQNVWFAYEPDLWVLKDVSFKVSPGQTVAFVGATGSGKTTILSLICRNYDIQKGKILIDGIDVRKIKISSLRKHFGQMLQDVFLFSGTVESNITLGLDVSREQVWQAMELVNAAGFVRKLPKGLDEEVRERGNNFSAGQRQLLSFARTVIHKPAVMIMDEATANIDTETEVLIQDSLEKMRNIGTMLVVAHRLSTVQHADNIILLSHGEIIEQGNHQQLLHQHGRYYKLYTLQHQKQELMKS